MPRGPISVTSITANTVVPPVERNTLVLKFPLYSEGSLGCEALARMLKDVIRDWNDGRYSFNAEMLGNGLSRCLKRALYEVEAQKASEEFGPEVVESEGGSGYVSRWSLEADKRYAEMRKPWIMVEPEVEILGPEE
jgi:hypothetical protein